MKRWLPLLLFLCCGSAAAAIVNVGGSQNAFFPPTITINAGDSVTFINKGGFHNVVADDGTFRCARGCDNDGKGGSGNASNANWATTITFNNAGTFGYFCELHGMPNGGMFGTVIVQGVQPPPPPPAVDPIPASSLAALLLLIAAIVWLAVRRARLSR